MFVIVLALLSLYSASRSEIKSLPGWQGALTSKMYSGFVYSGLSNNNPPGAMFMHYWFVESEGNPLKDPTIYWFNGGPGASSLFGLFVELGPLLLNELSLENEQYNKTKLIRNVFGWSKYANVIVTDNPPPVGFSYCNPAGPGTSCGPWNDSMVGDANHMFLSNWIIEFPEFKHNDFYIIGESYAGVYVPVLADRILKDPIPGINLVGVALGDPCLGSEVLCGGGVGPYSWIEFFHGHGQFSNSLYYQIQQVCSLQSLKTGVNITPQCNALITTEMYAEIGGYYAYNLYDDCAGKRIFQRVPGPKGTYLSENRNEELYFRYAGALNDYPCPGKAFAMYFNRSDVRRAISVPVDSNFFNEDNGNGFNYTGTEKNVLNILMKYIKSSQLRVLLYNGDTDPSINSFITQDILTNYFKSVNFPLTKKWRPWTLDGKIRMGGYVVEYGPLFQFLTIRGSGHMVPEYKPEASATFLSLWLQKKPFPPFSPN